MTVKEMSGILNLDLVSGSDHKEITGIYTGDFLSWVMSHAEPGDMWITVMNNVNILAVATLTDVACIVISDDSGIDASVIERANEKGITILTSKEGSAELVVKAAEVLGKI